MLRIDENMLKPVLPGHLLAMPLTINHLYFAATVEVLEETQKQVVKWTLAFMKHEYITCSW